MPASTPSLADCPANLGSKLRSLKGLRRVPAVKPRAPAGFGLDLMAGRLRCLRAPAWRGVCLDPLGPPLSNAQAQDGRMKRQSHDIHAPPPEELVATFGEARLVKTVEGKIALRGGSAEEQAQAREWMERFLLALGRIAGRQRRTARASGSRRRSHHRTRRHGTASREIHSLEGSRGPAQSPLRRATS